jgi:DNA-binding NtrC family response regulator
MSDTVHENPQPLVTDNEQLQRSSPTRRVAADQSDLELTARSQAFIDVWKQVERASNSVLPVLLIGAPRTGKQLVACAIHQRSPRGDQPFVAVNCSALPRDSIEAELFGLDHDRRGLWEQANGGTLFLDEITETDSSLQTKLLRALQTGQISRIGSDEPQQVDVRVIAATSRSLDQEVAAGRFHVDLFHALRALSILLPPLRTIQGTDQQTQISDESLNEEWVTLSVIEGRYVARVLNYTGGNKQAAARVLSVDRKTLDRMIKRHQINYPHARQRAKATVSS